MNSRSKQNNPVRPEATQLTGVEQGCLDHKSNEDKSSTIPRKRNAFSELMNAKPKQAKVELTPSGAISTTKREVGNFRSGLLPYITNPESFPQGTVIRRTEHTVLIRDLYPKAVVHLLLLPRDSAFYNLNPLDAFQSSNPENAKFLKLMRSEAAEAAQIAASELSRLVSPDSESCRVRNLALDSDIPPSELPLGRKFLSDIKIGIHAQPSMDTLHIHIVSVDNYSPCLKHKKHYNSFNTAFFVPLEDFPLDEGAEVMIPEKQTSLMKEDMKCWRCGKNFTNKFVQLKEHLKDEYEEWRRF